MDRRQIQPPREQSSDIDRYLFEDPELDEPLEPTQPVKKQGKLKRLFSRKKEPKLTEDDITPDRRYDPRNITVPRRMSVTDSASGSANGQSALGSGSIPGLARSGTPAGYRPFPMHPTPQRRFEGNRHLHGAEEGFGQCPALPVKPYPRICVARDFSSGSIDGQHSSSSSNPSGARRRPPVLPQPGVYSQPPRPRAVYDVHPQDRGMHLAPQAARQPSRQPMQRTARVVQVAPSDRTESVRSSLEVAPAPTPAALVIQPPQAYPFSSTPPPIFSTRSSSPCQSTRSGLFDSREGSHTPPTSVSSLGDKPRVRATSPEQNTSHFLVYEERPPAPTIVRQPSNSSSFRTVPAIEDQSRAEVRFLEEPTLKPPFQASNSDPISAPPSVALGSETRAQITVMTLEGLKAGGGPASAKPQVSNHLAWVQESFAKNAARRENFAQYSRHRGLGNLGTEASSDWH